MSIFPYKFHKPTRLSIMFYINGLILFFIIIGVNIMNYHRYKNILLILENKVERFQWPWKKTIDHKHLLIKKINIIDKETYYDLEIIMGQLKPLNKENIIEIQKEIENKYNYTMSFSEQLVEQNKIVTLKIKNIVDKNHMDSIISLITLKY